MTSAVFGFRKIRRKSDMSVHMLNHVRIHKAVQLESKFQRAGTWSAVAWLPAACVIAQQYSPAKNEMGWACGAYGGGESCAQGVGGEAWGKKTIGETQT
jgi:hypothetical protein